MSTLRACRPRAPPPPWRAARLKSTSPSSAAPAATSTAEKAKQGLPFLPRALGVPEPPGGAKPGWVQRREDLKDRDVFESKRMQERRHIIQEAAKGYFADLNATRAHGGKTWIAPAVLIRESRALYFPDVEGTALDTRQKVHTSDLCRGKVSVVSMLSSRISELHARGCVARANARYLADPRYQHVQINLQENVLRSLLVSVFVSSIRAQVPPALHRTYLLSTQNMEYARAPLGMTNAYVGYTFLVDEHLRVRWAACADAKPEEAAGLERCVGLLLDRMSEEKAAEAAVQEAPPAV